MARRSVHARDVTTTVATAPKVRSLTRHDLEAVIRIDRVHTGEAKPDYWSQVFREFVGPRVGRGRVGLAADVDGVVIGFLFGDIRAFEFGSEPCGWILEIGVHPAALRQGVGTHLLAEACRRLRAAGVSTIRTMVRRNDVPVLTFFRTAGFAGGPYVQLELTDADAIPGEV